MATSLLTFPNPVNEHAARFTAGLVVLLTLATISASGTVRLVLLGILTVGFLLRVAGGPRYSPFGRLSVHVLVPLFGRDPELTAGPPKRFAQAIGLVFSGLALALTLLSLPTAATIVLGILAVAATLESVLGFCLGCWVFSYLMTWGVIPESVCEECASVAKRRGNVTPSTIRIQQADAGVRVNRG